MKEKFLALPAPLKAVTTVLLLEALVLITWAVVLVVVAMQSGQMSVYASYAFGLFYLIVAGSILVAGNGVLERKRFARSLAIVWQLFAVIIGLQVFLAGASLGLLATIVGGIVLILFFTKSALAHFDEEPGKLGS